MRKVGRWLFSIPAVRMTALGALYLFPGLRRRLRVYVGVEGGMAALPGDAASVSPHAIRALAPRVAQIYADLDRGVEGKR